MIQSANNYQLSVLFNPEQNLKYSIPKYQREYVWQQRNWEALFDDILENDKGHFLGSMICINQSMDVHQTLRLELVDGQQRITTTSLLYAAIYTWLNLNADKSNINILVQMANTQNKLVLQFNEIALRLDPSRQGSNLEDYQWIMANAGIMNKEVSKPSNLGRRRLFRAYNYFLDRFKQLDTNSNPLFDTVKVLSFLDKLNGASMVKIEVNSHSDAFTLFETLNNRGEPLSALDLIKNKFLDVLDQHQINTIEQNFDIWTRLLNNLTEDPRVQQRYLRHYYNTFKYKPEVEIKGLTKATRSNLIDIYGKLIDKDVHRIFDDLYAKSKTYGRLVKPETDTNSSTVTEALLDLDRIGGVTSLGFLMFLVSEFPGLPEAEFTKTIKLLTRFFVRRNVTDTPPTRDLDKLFIELVDYCHSGQQTPTSDLIRAFLKQPAWDIADDLFEARLKGNLYTDNTDATRFILCSIEASHRTNETYTDLWKRYDSGQFYWTIEHILPQGRNLPSEWINMVAQGDALRAAQLQDAYVHQLGNLTISGYNSTLGNLAFDQKRERKDKKGNSVGYKNGLYLNHVLAQKADWKIEDIEVRTRELVKECKVLFSL